MSAVNETLMVVLDNTISCSVGPNEVIIRTLALLGLITIVTSTLKGLAFGVGYPIAYFIGFLKWVYKLIRGKRE